MRGCGGDNSIIMFREICTVYTSGDSQSVSSGMADLSLLGSYRFVKLQLKLCFVQLIQVERKTK